MKYEGTVIINEFENYEVLCSEVLNMKREWRCFVKYDEIADIKPYRGDYHYNYDPNVVDQIMESFKTISGRPMGCSVDIAVVDELILGVLQSIGIVVVTRFALVEVGADPRVNDELAHGMSIVDLEQIIELIRIVEAESGLDRDDDIFVLRIIVNTVKESLQFVSLRKETRAFSF
mgnify:CR=1 FL=1